MTKRRVFLAASGAMLAAPSAWAWPYMPHLMKKPRAPAPLTVGDAEAAHLLRRVGLGYNERDAKQIVGLPLATAVDRLLWLPDEEPLPAPDCKPQQRRAQLTQEATARAMEEGSRWWMATMMATSDPVRERMTLFWHGHFASSWRKVGSAPLMLRQNMKWRSHALGNFAEFAGDMLTDPAMLVYLDASRSTSRALDQRFARTLMQTFLMGSGFYFDADVKDTARALTGMTVRQGDIEKSFLFMPAMHDPGRKTIFGKTGYFDYRDALRLILRHELCAAHIARSLARELVGPDVDEEAVQGFAQQFRRGDFEIRALLRAILLSPEFWAPEHRGALVKSPVVLTLELARFFGVPKEAAGMLVAATSEMGQELFDPPGVAGWPGGKEWLQPNALAARRSFVARAMASGSAMFASAVLEPAQMAALARAHLAVPLDVSGMNGASQAMFLRELFETREFQVA